MHLYILPALNLTSSITVKISNQTITTEQDLQQHCANLIQKLHNEYEEGRASICQLMDQSASKVKSLCVTLKVETGFHAGQKFRLEPTEVCSIRVPYNTHPHTSRKIYIMRYTLYNAYQYSES